MAETNIFSSDGRLLQLEYASDAIKLGSIILGIKTKYCVVLFLEKRKDDILNENIIGQKMIKFSKFLGCTVSGLTSDARLLIEQIQTKFENTFFTSNQFSGIENFGRIILNLASYIEESDERKIFKNRPLGVAFLVGGLDNDGFTLLQIDPSGILKKKDFASLGSGQDESALIIKEGYRKNMSLNESLVLGKKTLKLLTEKNFEYTTHNIFSITK